MQNSFTLVALVAAFLAASLGVAAAKQEPNPAKSPSFTVPKGWKPTDTDKVGFVTAKFTAGKGDKEVVVVLLKAGGGLEANVNRWRAQVGLTALEKEEVSKTLQPIKVGGLPAHILDVKGSKTGGEGMLRIVGVIVPRGDEMW